MPEITTNDGVRLHYVTHGEGRPIVLVGGWCMSTPWWKNQMDGLADRHQVVAIDPRSYGESDKPPHGHRMARHAHDLDELLTALDLEDVVAVGWSLGANVLLSHWELFQRGRIGAMVSVDQSPYCVNGDDWDLGFGTAEQAQAFLAAFAADPRGGADGLIDVMFYEPVSDTDRQWMLSEMLKIPAAHALQLEYDHIFADWRDVVPTVTLPVLVMTGRHSKVFPWRSGAWLADQLPNSQHVVFEQSGHCPFFEEPQRFNEELARFAS